MFEVVADGELVAEDGFVLGSEQFQSQTAPKFAALAGGGFVAVWQGNDGFNDYGVKAQVYDASGREVGGEILVNENTPRVQAEPTVTALATGGFVIGWADEGAYPETFDIRAKLYDAAGEALSSSFLVNTTVTGFQVQPRITAVEGGGFAIAWEDSGQQWREIRSQLYSSDGSTVGSETIVSSGVGDEYIGNIAGLAGGGFVVAWFSFTAEVDGNGNLDSGTKAQIIDAEGNAVGGAFALNDAQPGAQTQPTIESLPGGGFVSVWSDSGSAFGTPTGREGIWLQIFDAAGGRSGAAIRVVDQPGFPSLAVADDGTMVLTWTGVYGSPDPDLLAMRLDASGQPAGAPFAVNTSPGSVENQPDVVVLESGAIVVGWTDLSAPQFNDSDVRARIFFPFLQGNAGADVLVGTADRDFFAGNDGDDRVSGLGDDDYLNGGIGSDVLQGGAGNDWLDGGAGRDTLVGGAGDDHYVVDDSGDRVVESLGGGSDTIETVIDYRLARDVESLILTGSAAIDGTGNDLTNLITGNAAGNVLDGGAGGDRLIGGDGNDLLIGGTGGDTMFGGRGDDQYRVDDADDIVSEMFFEGYDTVVASVDYSLSDGVEKLVLTGRARVGTGNDQENTVLGGAGADTLSGMNGNDSIQGNAGADQIDGGAGDDTLYGGLGRDVLTGGVGADRFVFRVGDSGATAASADRVTDFSHAQGDRISLAAIDANEVPPDTAFSFIGTAAFSGVAGQLRYGFFGGDTLIEGDTNGDGVGDLAIRLSGNVTLVAGDFVL